MDHTGTRVGMPGCYARSSYDTFGTLHEGSNTFYMNPRTFPSIFELRDCFRQPTVVCWLLYAVEAHPFDIWWGWRIYRSLMPTALDRSTFRSNIRVKNADLNVRTPAVSPDKLVRTFR